MDGGKNIFWVDEIRTIIKANKLSKSDAQRLNRLCECYEELYGLVCSTNQKSVITKYLNWFHDTHTPSNK